MHLRIGTRLAGRRHPAGPAGALRPMLLFTDGLAGCHSMSRAAGLMRAPAAEESPGWTTSASTSSQHVPVVSAATTTSASGCVCWRRRPHSDRSLGALSQLSMLNAQPLSPPRRVPTHSHSARYPLPARTGGRQ